MRTLILFIATFSLLYTLHAQTFIRSELSTPMDTPWEIIYGPDNYLWVTEAGGKVSRINPETGAKIYTYTAPDYFDGDTILERHPLCFMPDIGSGTLGMALDPDFMNQENAFIYVVYSYNNGTALFPDTRFKVVKLEWDWSTQTVVGSTDIITRITSGYDHLGGRLMAITREGEPYLFLTVGDHGISERNSPDCYNPQSTNPNNLVQETETDNGKVHRFNLDGTIPDDNPIAGNSFYTRGHRNPQGLIYIPQLDMLFDVEHGDRTDDEINLLEAGMNYGWKWVRGYHADNNFPGEAEFIANYESDSSVVNDRLVEAYYSWCAEPQPDNDDYLSWCTPAPSDGIYYNATGVPEWTHSLLVVSLKNGTTTDNEVHVFKLMPGSGQLVPSTTEDPNPTTFFGEDQELNGRLRDITFSPDGRKIFLINNGGEGIRDKITVYSVISTWTGQIADGPSIQIHPNPAHEVLYFQSPAVITGLEIYSLSGEKLRSEKGPLTQTQIKELAPGTYVVKLSTDTHQPVSKLFTRL